MTSIVLKNKKGLSFFSGFGLGDANTFVFHVRKIVVGKNKIAGRNRRGQIVMYNRGGGNKKRSRIVDYYRYVWNILGMVLSVEYDPNRHALLALIIYTNGIMCYILKSRGLRVGNVIGSFHESVYWQRTKMRIKFTKLSCSRALLFFPLGALVHAIENFPGLGGKIARAAGGFAKFISKSARSATLKLRSLVLHNVPIMALACLGIVSTFNFRLYSYKKAAYFIHKGWKPRVRGVAMNPIDHPHGGGEGRTSGGRPSVSAWGLLTKGKPTRRKKKPKLVYAWR